MFNSSTMMSVAFEMIVEIKTKNVDFTNGKNIKFKIMHFLSALCVCSIDCVHVEGNSENK